MTTRKERERLVMRLMWAVMVALFAIVYTCGRMNTDPDIEDLSGEQFGGVTARVPEVA